MEVRFGCIDQMPRMLGLPASCKGSNEFRDARTVSVVNFLVGKSL